MISGIGFTLCMRLAGAASVLPEASTTLSTAIELWIRPCPLVGTDPIGPDPIGPLATLSALTPLATSDPIGHLPLASFAGKRPVRRDQRISTALRWNWCKCASADRQPPRSMPHCARLPRRWSRPIRTATMAPRCACRPASSRLWRRSWSGLAAGMTCRHRARTARIHPALRGSP